MFWVNVPVVQLVWQTIIAPLHTIPIIGLAIQLLVGLPVVVTSAYLFFRVCERPFMTHPKV